MNLFSLEIIISDTLSLVYKDAYSPTPALCHSTEPTQHRNVSMTIRNIIVGNTSLIRSFNCKKYLKIIEAWVIKKQALTGTRPQFTALYSEIKNMFIFRQLLDSLHSTYRPFTTTQRKSLKIANRLAKSVWNEPSF